jgi:hypothetical protein
MSELFTSTRLKPVSSKLELFGVSKTASSSKVEEESSEVAESTGEVTDPALRMLPLS